MMTKTTTTAAGKAALPLGGTVVSNLAVASWKHSYAMLLGAGFSKRQITVAAVVSLSLGLAFWAAVMAFLASAFASPAAALPFGSIGVVAPQLLAGGLSIPVVNVALVSAAVVGLTGYAVYRACKSETPKKQEDGE